MSVFVATLLIILGIAFLWRGAVWLVHGSASLARWFGISSLVVGLTVVAFGTSMPELVVNFTAAIRGNTDLAIGNIIGSNIANILLILGIAAIIVPLTVQSSMVWKEIPFSLLAAIILGIFANDIFLYDGRENVIGRGNGLALILFFVIFLYYILGLARQKQTHGELLAEARADVAHHFGRHTVLRMVGYIVVGLTALYLGGQALVAGATTIARVFGVSEAIIGLTIVAVGTSLPELVASIVAAMRKEPDIAVGNIVGSNIFNIFWILGATAVIRPLPVSRVLNLDMMVLVATSCVLFGAILFWGKRFVITRGNGILFLCLYIAYIAFLIMREVA